MRAPVSFNSSESKYFSIVAFLNSTEPVFLISGIPDIATVSPALNLVSIYCGPNHFALAAPVSSFTVSVAILNRLRVVNTETSLISTNIVISLISNKFLTSSIVKMLDLSICFLGKNLIKSTMLLMPDLLSDFIRFSPKPLISDTSTLFK